MEPVQPIISRLLDKHEDKLFSCCVLAGQWGGQMGNTDMCM